MEPSPVRFDVKQRGPIEDDEHDEESSATYKTLWPIDVAIEKDMKIGDPSEMREKTQSTFAPKGPAVMVAPAVAITLKEDWLMGQVAALEKATRRTAATQSFVERSEGMGRG
jgi:hypothetical protein